jgi:hypothetical protein
MTRKTVTTLALLTVIAAVAWTALRAQSTAPSKPPATSQAAASGAKALTNADIVQLVKVGIPTDAILKKIKTSKSAFDTSPSAVAALRKDGVPDAVIIEMVLANKSTATDAAAEPSGSLPPLPSQSEAENEAPCASGRPILKRGKQPTLPPCPDPPPDAAPSAPSSADSTSTRAPNPKEPLIERAREVAFEFSEKLPNFICEEFMSRYTQRGRGTETPLDVVSAEVIYDNAQESYRNVKINDRPTGKSMQEIGGASSTGEFASTLLDLFHPDTRAQFQAGGATTISGFAAQVYDFQVRSENSHWDVHSDAQTMTPAYGGSVWVDPETARVLRIEMQARNIPSDFPMDTVESSVDYSYVKIGDTEFLLPVHAESLGCQRGTNYCSHNIIDFRNYHEYTATIKIGP